MLHLAMVRSAVAHGTITEIDVTAAKEMPGVVAVYTGADFDAEQGGMPCAWPINADAKHPRHVSIAVDKVNFAGEIVAIVVARSAAEAEGRRRRRRGRHRRPRRPCSTWRRRSPRAPTSSTPTSARTSGSRSRSTPRRRAHVRPGADEVIAAAENDPDSVVVTPHVAPAAADPGVHGAALGGRRPDR